MKQPTTNDDILEMFLDDCKRATKKEIIKEWGGASIYIPSYSGKLRDKDIKKRYKELLEEGLSKGVAVRRVAKEFGLSASRIYKILKEN